MTSISADEPSKPLEKGDGISGGMGGVDFKANIIVPSLILTFATFLGSALTRIGKHTNNLLLDGPPTLRSVPRYSRLPL
jgi:hypothetical protein